MFYFVLLFRFINVVLVTSWGSPFFHCAWLNMFAHMDWLRFFYMMYFKSKFSEYSNVGANFCEMDNYVLKCTTNIWQSGRKDEKRRKSRLPRDIWCFNSGTVSMKLDIAGSPAHVLFLLMIFFFFCCCLDNCYLLRSFHFFSQISI